MTISVTVRLAAGPPTHYKLLGRGVKSGEVIWRSDLHGELAGGTSPF